MKYIDKIENKKLKNAVKKALEDYKPQLIFIPSSMTGKHHPYDERGKEGLLKHIEKVAWFVYQASIGLKLTSLERDILLTSAYFHDLGKVKETKVVQKISYPSLERTVEVSREIKKDLHPIYSSEIAEEYLKKEGVETSIINQIKKIIISHMSHWYPYLPQPETNLEKLFYLADFITSRDNFNLKL